MSAVVADHGLVEVLVGGKPGFGGGPVMRASTYKGFGFLVDRFPLLVVAFQKSSDSSSILLVKVGSSLVLVFDGFILFPTLGRGPPGPAVGGATPFPALGRDPSGPAVGGATPIPASGRDPSGPAVGGATPFSVLSRVTALGLPLVVICASWASGRSCAGLQLDQ